MLDAIRQIVHILHDLIIVDHLRSTLQETAMQVEYVTRISLTARRATEQQGYLTVSYGLLGKIIINNQCRTTSITEEFTDRSTGERSIELQRSRLRSRCSNDHCVRHSTIVSQRLHYL